MKSKQICIQENVKRFSKITCIEASLFMILLLANN